MKRPTLWYLLADGAHARIIQHDPDQPGHGLTILWDSMASSAHAKTRDLVSDRPGRAQESSAHARHAVNGSDAAHRQEEARFIGEVLHYVEGENDSFDRMIIYAAPRVLAQLRAKLSPSVRARLQAEHPKDLANVPLTELPSHFER